MKYAKTTADFMNTKTEKVDLSPKSIDLKQGR